MTVKATGLDEVLRALEVELPRQAEELSADLFKGVAKAIAEDAATRAPVQSGNLRGSIKSRKEGDTAEVYVQRGGKGDAYYWRFLEYGQGPDGVEHAFFLRAREAVLADGRFIDKFRKKLTTALKRL